METHIDWICEHAAIVRVFAEGKRFGDPYEWACSLKVINEHTIELCGVTQPPTIAQARSIWKQLLIEGYRFLQVNQRGKTLLLNMQKYYQA